MTSLRWRLFLILALSTGAIWLSAAGWTYLHTKAEIERVLDTRLQEAARMVGSLVLAGDAQLQGALSAPLAHPELLRYQRQLACQVWSLDGRLVARSAGSPEGSLSDSGAGFSERLINGEPWRTFAIQDVEKGLRILVGDRLGLRERLVGDLMRGLMAPAGIIVPLLGFLIWASIRGGLRPLQSMADELQSRGADDMRPIPADRAPSEIAPIASALNSLFVKVESARQREREVIAFAAHELRTPLAGLRTQAQVAIAAADSAVREGALQNILVAVDRTARLVKQLLILAKLDAVLDLEHAEEVDVRALLQEIVNEVEAADGPRLVMLEPSLDGVTVRGNRELMTLALRNLHENAIIHTAGDGAIRWGAESSGATLFVEDEGPGIPEEELSLVTQRFFRGRHRAGMGSGLGLAIADVAVSLTGATLQLRNKEGTRGLRAEISMDAITVCGARV